MYCSGEAAYLVDLYFIGYSLVLYLCFMELRLKDEKPKSEG